MARSAAKARERGFCKIHPRERKNSFAKEWRKVLAKGHVIRTKSHEVFNTAQLESIQIGSNNSTLIKLSRLVKYHIIGGIRHKTFPFDGVPIYLRCSRINFVAEV